MGQLVFSEHVLLALVQKGVTREDGYKICQRNAAKCWDDGVSFRQALEKDEAVTSVLNCDELAECFNLEHHLRNVDTILDRLGVP
jgi:adenylosuccinate lyase